MANPNKPSGLTAVDHIFNSGFVGRTRTYFIPVTDTNVYAVGDPVITATGAADTNGISAITLATGTGAIRGVIASLGGPVFGGVNANPAAQFEIVIPATKAKAYYVQVIDDPMVIFTVQEFSGTGSTNFTASDVGKNANLKLGTNNGYVSGWTLDDTAASSTVSTGQVRLLGLTQLAGAQNTFGSYALWNVLINNHEFKAAVAGV